VDSSTPQDAKRKVSELVGIYADLGTRVNAERGRRPKFNRQPYPVEKREYAFSDFSRRDPFEHVPFAIVVEAALAFRAKEMSAKLV
jgi:hypothetical protein